MGVLRAMFLGEEGKKGSSREGCIGGREAQQSEG